MPEESETESEEVSDEEELEKSSKLRASLRASKSFRDDGTESTATDLTVTVKSKVK